LGPSTTSVFLGVFVSTVSLRLILNETSKWSPQKNSEKELTVEQLRKKEIADRKQVTKDWYDNKSHQTCEEEFKKNLRNPSSYTRDGDILIVTDDGSKKNYSMEI